MKTPNRKMQYIICTITIGHQNHFLKRLSAVTTFIYQFFYALLPVSTRHDRAILQESR